MRANATVTKRRDVRVCSGPRRDPSSSLSPHHTSSNGSLKSLQRSQHPSSHSQSFNSCPERCYKALAASASQGRRLAAHPSTKHVLLQRLGETEHRLYLPTPVPPYACTCKERTCCLPCEQRFSPGSACHLLPSRARSPKPGLSLTEPSQRELQAAETSRLTVHSPPTQWGGSGVAPGPANVQHKPSPGDESRAEAWTGRGEHAQGTHRHLVRPAPCPRGHWLLAEGTGDTDNISSYMRKI